MSQTNNAIQKTEETRSNTRITSQGVLATPKKHTFFRLWVHERVAISKAEVCEKVSKSVISACKRT